MATTTHVSTPASGAVAIFELITLLLAAGWRVTRWSDATTYTDATGAPLASNPYGSGASGAGNLGNTSAWFTVRASDSSREWLFQRNASDAAWTINRSKAGFVGGSPAATTLPTATDATALFTAASAFSATPGRLFISADDSDSFGWRLMVMVTGGGNVRTLIIDEPLASADPGGTDPYLWIGYHNGTGLNPQGARDTFGRFSSGLVYTRDTVAGVNRRIPFFYWLEPSTGNSIPPQNSTVQYGQLFSNGREVIIPILCALENVGWVGFTSTLRWSTVAGGRANGDTLDGTTAYWLFAAGLWLPWDSSVPALS